MMKISKKASNIISDIFTAVIFAILVAAIFALPPILQCFIVIFGKPDYYFTVTLIILYAALIPAFAADISLHLLLRNIKNQLIFSESSVKHLRKISFCCLLEGIIFFILGFYYYTSFLVSFAAVFMGVILRVVKNVIEEATAIKSENDYTI